MKKKLSTFDNRQVMRRPDYEIQHKLDLYLKDVKLHHHDFFEVYFLVSGDVTYSIEGRMYHLKPGDMLFVSPQELHSALIRPDMAPYERYVLWIAPELLANLSSPQSDLMHCFSGKTGYKNHIHIPSAIRRNIRDSMEMIFQESELETTAFGADLMGHSLITTLLVQLNRAVSERDAAIGDEEEKPDPSSVLVTNVVDYLNLHYSEPISLDQLAEQFFVSKFHLSHTFTQTVGTSIYRYLQKKRLQIARQLLAQGEKASKIFSTCGFTDYAGFYRAFRAEYGLAPRDYASSIRQQQAAEQFGTFGQGQD